MIGTADTSRAKLLERGENTARERKATRVGHHVHTGPHNRPTSSHTTPVNTPPPHSAAQCSVFFFWQWQCVHTQGTEVDERRRLAKRSGSRELDTHAIEAQLSTQS